MSSTFLHLSLSTSSMSLTPPSLSLKLPTMENTSSSELTPTKLGFPNEFPYEFDSPAFTPGFTSPGDSTETEDESSDDEEDFLAGLTRRLAPSTQRNTKPEEKLQVKATSPQSTLSGLGSLSTTSFRRDNAFDVISAAAGEVAKLKMSIYEPHHQNGAFQGDQSLQRQRFDHMWLCSQSRTHFPNRVMNREALLENLRYIRRNTISTATWQLQGTPLKRPSTGTGVFLPRRYPTTTTPSSESCKKPTHVSNGAVNGRVMMQSKVNEFTSGGPRFSQLDYESMIARSRLVAASQGNMRSVNGGCLIQERCLPQDWMY